MEKRIVIEVDEKLHSEVKSLAYKQGKTLREVIEKLLTEWVKDNG